MHQGVSNQLPVGCSKYINKNLKNRHQNIDIKDIFFLIRQIIKNKKCIYQLTDFAYNIKTAYKGRLYRLGITRLN